jgi:hypothetical protein
MDIKALSLETPTPILVWQLPRRFDAVTWFVRLQRENPILLNNVRVSIPQIGPSLLQVQEGTRAVQNQLGFTGETLLGSGIFPWHGHAAYLENLGQWTARHAPDWPAVAPLTWILCLHRDAWLAVARTWLPSAETSWHVKSAWLTLALSSADLDLLALIPEQAYDHRHAQVYADETVRTLQWMESSRPQDIPTWVDAISKRSFFKNIVSRFPAERRDRFFQNFPHLSPI